MPTYHETTNTQQTPIGRKLAEAQAYANQKAKVCSLDELKVLANEENDSLVRKVLENKIWQLETSQVYKQA